MERPIRVGDWQCKCRVCRDRAAAEIQAEAQQQANTRHMVTVFCRCGWEVIVPTLAEIPDACPDCARPCSKPPPGWPFSR
jgi:hypothetical protein